jgi:hypothetical protein
MRTIDKPARLVPNIERMVVARIEQLEAQDLIGSVRVIEEGEHIIAEIDGGRLLTLGAAPDVTYGAQEASGGSLSIRARRR